MQAKREPGAQRLRASVLYCPTASDQAGRSRYGRFPQEGPESDVSLLVTLDLPPTYIDGVDLVSGPCWLGYAGARIGYLLAVGRVVGFETRT
jgi:hypothetical protein